MGTRANIIQLCRSMVHSHGSSHLQVEANSVTWKVFVHNGQLQYAVHSLQTLEMLMHHLAKLGCALSVSVREGLTSSMKDAQPWDLHLQNAIKQLEQQGLITAAVSKAVKLSLSKDALESLLWLPEVKHSIESYQTDYMSLMPLETVLDELESRLQSWQQLQPVVKSPYQQISCPDNSRLNQPVVNGQLNQSLLSMLAQLMQGNSLYHVAFLLKQDSLRVAQLLSPYIQQHTFVLTYPVFPLNKLPSVPRRILPQISHQTLSVSQPQKAPKIVCIDDSPAMLDTLKSYLETDGFDVATLENPMESMSMLFAMKPDMILMDVSMPGINGRRLCEILRRSSAFKDLPIIIVSSNASVLDKAKAESSGATDYLQKPFSQAELLAIVKAHLKMATHV
ncbi:response regulator receiver protein [Leptolyngbya sp. Heron Island J]|uniref:response regulator n=1 Tax=Leptolyngbya sp. Heron Island J TaxID=1385935 RepID=UPI0003B9FAF1|nr:response regulator [Leptolyngbya sp. Heron Island J]ESA35530.1 response regulator receiver protein [Leptolyngbya sp. Heron Island J]